MTSEQRAKHVVERLMHQSHLRYQRASLAGDTRDKYVTSLPNSEVRGVRATLPRQEFCASWFTHLRPNFWRAYFETLVVMSR
jgi:hypothetical protein